MALAGRRMNMKKVAAAAKWFGLVFVAALVMGACGGTMGARTNATPVAVVHGKVMAGPTCPVERVGVPCPPRPVIATIEANIGTHVAARTRSAADGTYRLELPSGMYTMYAATALAFPRCNPKRVRVVAPASVDVDISCDTGIR
jgi:hypothetical protein